MICNDLVPLDKRRRTWYAYNINQYQTVRNHPVYKQNYGTDHWPNGSVLVEA